MMYETIYKALVEVGLEGAFSPQDYLNFFCLGNREVVDGVEDGSPTAANSPQVSFFYNLKRLILLSTYCGTSCSYSWKTLLAQYLRLFFNSSSGGIKENIKNK